DDDVAADVRSVAAALDVPPAALEPAAPPPEDPAVEPAAPAPPLADALAAALRSWLRDASAPPNVCWAGARDCWAASRPSWAMRHRALPGPVWAPAPVPMAAAATVVVVVAEPAPGAPPWGPPPVGPAAGDDGVAPEQAVVAVSSATLAAVRS